MAPFSLPVVTIGLATAAVYHTVVQVICNGKGTLWTTFIRSIRENLRHAIPIQIGIYILYGILALECYLSYTDTRGILIVPLICGIFLMSVLKALELYLYPLLGHYVLTVGQLFVMTLQVVILHIARSLILLVAWLIGVAAVVSYPPLIMIIPGAFTMLSYKICTPVFEKYIRVESETVPQE